MTECSLRANWVRSLFCMLLGFIFFLLLLYVAPISHYFVIVTALISVFSFSNYLEMLYFKLKVYHKQLLQLYEVEVRPHLWDYTSILFLVFLYTGIFPWNQCIIWFHQQSYYAIWKISSIALHKRFNCCDLLGCCYFLISFG